MTPERRPSGSGNGVDKGKLAASYFAIHRSEAEEWQAESSAIIRTEGAIRRFWRDGVLVSIPTTRSGPYAVPDGS
jgi:hypothetical protein